MRLPESLFHRIVSALNPGQQPAVPESGANGSGGEREWKRRATRRKVNAQVWYVRQGAPEGRPQAGTILDISKVGLGIVLESVAAPGERLVVYLPCAPDEATGGAGPGEGNEPIAVLCTVRTCRVRSDGRFRVGAEFIDPNSAEADGPGLLLTVDGLMGLTDGGAGGDSDPLRREERHEADGRATMYLYRQGRQAPLEHVPVADLSESGVAIFRGEPLQVGDEFVIRVPRTGESPITRLCRVANVVPFDGRYRIGAQFVPFRGRGLLSRLRDWIA